MATDPTEALDAAIQEFVLASYGSGLLSSWVLVTESVPTQGVPEGLTVMNYGGPQGQSWVRTSGLLRWATMHHEGLA